MLLTCPAATAAEGGLAADPDVRAFVGEMARRHGFEAERLQALFAGVQVLEPVLAAIARPAEAKPWHQYRPIFVTPERIQGGIAFWREHEAALDKAERRFGVAPEIIVAIIGVETYYGKHTGRYRVLDALATLAFRYPKRARFFRSELEQFLLLAREQEFDGPAIQGSYAGAMGMPQFISSSYRSYAVDFDDDGVKDLFGSPTDAIGSVASYLARHGWRRDGAIALPAALRGEAAEALVAKGSKPHLAAGDLRAQGVVAQGELDAAEPTALVRLETANGHEHWVTLRNFYAITRYNHSDLYAMAVSQLGEAIRVGREQAVSQ